MFTHVSDIGFLVLFCFYLRKKNCPINDTIASFGSQVEKADNEIQTKGKGSLPNCNDCEMVSKCKNDLKVHIEMYTGEVANSSHCCGTAFPSALALKSHKRYKHLRKTCKIRKKTFHSLSKLKSPEKAFHKGRNNLQVIVTLVDSL